MSFGLGFLQLSGSDGLSVNRLRNLSVRNRKLKLVPSCVGRQSTLLVSFSPNETQHFDRIPGFAESGSPSYPQLNLQ